MEKNTIKNLKVKSTVYNICGKGCVLIGTGFLGGAIALGMTGQSNVGCALISFSLLSTGVQLMFDTSSIKYSENTHKKSILGQRKYYSHMDDEIPILGRRKFYELEKDAYKNPMREVEPLLTEEELQDVKLDASAIESKPLVKHK